MTRQRVLLSPKEVICLVGFQYKSVLNCYKSSISTGDDVLFVDIVLDLGIYKGKVDDVRDKVNIFRGNEGWEELAIAFEDVAYNVNKHLRNGF